MCLLSEGGRRRVASVPPNRGRDTAHTRVINDDARHPSDSDLKLAAECVEHETEGKQPVQPGRGHTRHTEAYLRRVL